VTSLLTHHAIHFFWASEFPSGKWGSWSLSGHGPALSDGGPGFPNPFVCSSPSHLGPPGGSTCSPAPLSLHTWHTSDTQKYLRRLSAWPRQGGWRDKAGLSWDKELTSSVGGRCGPQVCTAGAQTSCPAPGFSLRRQVQHSHCHFPAFLSRGWFCPLTVNSSTRQTGFHPLLQGAMGLTSDIPTRSRPGGGSASPHLMPESGQAWSHSGHEEDCPLGLGQAADTSPFLSCSRAVCGRGGKDLS
jgi:hypothetical protein